LLVWATAWWLWAGVIEIDRLAPAGRELDVLLMLGAGTALAAVLAVRRLEWPRRAALGFLALGAAVVGIAAWPLEHAHPLAGYGWAAWPAVFGVHYAFLRWCEQRFPRLQAAAHAIGYWAIALLLVLEAEWQVGRVAGQVWPMSAAIAGAA